MKYLEQKQILMGIAIVVVVISIIGYYFYKNVYTKEEIIISEEQNTTEKTTKELKSSEEQIIIHIAGEIQNPGIIKTTEGARIADIIEKAGGLKEEADLTDINLAYPVEDGQKIIIPKQGEKKEEYITEESGIKEEVTTTKPSQEANQTKTINLNKATKEELQTLQGIGEATAEKIITYRKENRKFSNHRRPKKCTRNRRCQI